jgi:L-threonylcarbamoyladenylate synthase
MEIDNKILIQKLQKGSIAVMPTDTIYGILGIALNKKTVERIYKLKGRNSKKPFIILISSPKDLALFKVTIDKKTETVLKKVWPGKVSVILPCPGAKFSYLHRGMKSLAFRLPKNKKLLELLKYTGPLVAPSTNPEGFPPAKTITEAKEYFKDEIDFYIGGKKIESSPSRLIRLKNNKIEILR